MSDSFSAHITGPDRSEVLASGEGELIHLKFLARVRENPDATAILFDQRAYSYAEVERRSRALAGRLAGQGASRGSRIAILAERGPELVWSMLAVARLGGVFIVLDAAYPEARLATLTEIAAPEVFVRAGGEALVAPAEHLAALRGAPLIDASADAGPGGAEHTLDQGSPDDPAYFLFTSGSTGTPKCVACTHRPLSHFVAWHIETFGLSPSDRFTMLAGLSHDPLLRDIFTPLSLGATLAIPRQSDITEPGALAPWFKRTGATVAHLTPAMGQLLAAGGARVERLPQLRQLFWGGDRLPPARIAEVAKLAPGALHANFYGSTETPQAAAYFRYDGAPWSPSVPIGKGAHGFQLLIVDDARQPVRSGEEGEIAVRSNYLSSGYVTDGRILPPQDRGTDPLGVANIYYTGDRGRYLPDGNVMILGRADDQVKVRGYRVDLSEITSALLAHPAVANGLVVATGEGAGLRIVAFAAGQAGGRLDNRAVSEFLADRLPAYMLPHEVRVLDALPLLPNGKVDRRALQQQAAPAAAAPEPARATAHANETEHELIEAWASLFTTARVTRETSFAGLGGDSLSYVQAYLATEEVLGVVPGGWQEMTVAELAAQRTKPSRIWTVIDTPMLIRAAAIVLVVAGHLQLLRYGDGATTALFLVSGYLFGGLQLREAFRRQSPVPILRSFRNIFVPTFLYALVAFAQKSLRGHQTTVNIVLMNNDFVDYSALEGGKAQDYQIHLWYVDALLKMLLFLSLGLVLARWTRLLRVGVFRFALALFALGCVTRFTLPGLFEPDFYVSGVRELSIWAYAPTTHFATFMLGVLVANASERATRWIVGAMVLVYAAASAHFFGWENAAVAAIAGVVLITASRVPVPRPVAKLAFVLSGASLFIYLTHYMFGSATRHVVGEGWQALEVLAGLLGGIAVWRCWTWLLKQIARFAPRASVAESGATA